MIRVTSFIIFLWVIFFSSWCSAERVFIKAYDGGQGHGWMFGATGQTANQCWIAVPYHVIESSDGILHPFTFTDMFRVSGESGKPIHVVSVPGAVEAAGGNRDLAFARVEVGRRTGECMSRLGLPHYAYNSMIRKSPKYVLFSMRPGSFGVIDADLVRVGTQLGGSVFDIQPDPTKSIEEYVRAGISGSTVEAQKGAEMVPFGMVLKANPKKGSLRALRFDRVKASFGIVEAHYASREREEKASSEGISFKIVSYKGITLTSAIGPSSLVNKDNWWEIVPDGGKRAVHVTIEMVDSNQKLSNITLIAKRKADEGQLEYFVDQRISGISRDWTRKATCIAEAVGEIENAKICHIDLRGPRQLRLTIPTRGPILLNSLTLH